MAPLLIALRRWRLRFGTQTLYFGAIAALLSAVSSFHLGMLVLPALLAGLILDGLCSRLRPGPARPRRTLVFAGLAPLIFWSLFLLTATLTWGNWWPLELTA